MRLKSIRFVVFFSYCLLLTTYSLLSSVIPPLMSYQAKVTDVDGVGITDTLEIRFSIWNDLAAGDSLWGETQTNVPIIKGLFDIQLGSVNPIGLAFDTTYYLQIVVDGDLLMPRTKLITSPYAFRAKFADSLISACGDGDWQVEGDTMHALPGGNVGVGISSPVAKLHVVVDNCDTTFIGNTFQDGFEDSTLAPFTAGTYPWFITNGSASEGTKSARSAEIDHDQYSDMELTMVTGFGIISFDRRVSSEEACDRLKFFIDTVRVAVWSGDLAWSNFSYPITAGTHIFRWRYEKDWSVSSYLDRAWVDNVQIIDTTLDINCGSDFALYSSGSNIDPAGIFMDGNVGIGTETPDRTLVVSGNMRVENEIDINGEVNINDAVNTIGDLSVDGDVNVTGNVAIAGNLIAAQVDSVLTIRGMNHNTIHGTTQESDKESIRMAGPTSDYIISLQDGSGRIQHYWNSTTSVPSENKYLVSGEPAWMWDLTISSDPYMEFKYAPEGTEGDTIDWTTHMAFEHNGNIGIGVTDPLARLHVSSGTSNAKTASFQGNYDISSNADFISSDFTYNPTADNTAYLNGYYSQMSTAPGCPYNYGGLTGASYEIKHEGTGIILLLNGLNSYVEKASTIATVNNAIGLRTEVAGGNDGFVVNAYGVYITDNTGTAILNSYGLFQQGADDVNFFAGDVGIGTFEPYDPLHIQAYDSTDGTDDGVFISVRNTCNADSAYSGIRFKNHSDDDDQYYKAGIVYQRTTSYGRGDLLFLNDNQSNNTNADLNDARMVITRGGNVGINSRDPDNRLEVKGSTVLNGSLNWGGTSTGSGNPYEITIEGIDSYTAGMVVAFQSHVTNPIDGPTRSINTMTAKNIKHANNDIVTATQIGGDDLIILIYNGTNFRWISD